MTVMDKATRRGIRRLQHDRLFRAYSNSAEWDILIVGRSVTEAVQPANAKLLFGMVHDRKEIR
jgi:hypothetical protein